MYIGYADRITVRVVLRYVVISESVLKFILFHDIIIPWSEQTATILYFRGAVGSG